MSKIVYLWDREDGSKIKAVAQDREVEVGKVYAVDPEPGRGGLADRARVTLAASRRVIPQDEAEAGRIRAARSRVSLRDAPAHLTIESEITWADEAPGGGE